MVVVVVVEVVSPKTYQEDILSLQKKPLLRDHFIEDKEIFPSLVFLLFDFVASFFFFFQSAISIIKTSLSSPCLTLKVEQLTMLRQ